MGWFAWGLVGCVMLAPGRQGEPPIPVDAYWTQVEQTAGVIEGLEGAPAEEARRALDAEAAIWEGIEAVRLPDGSVLAVETGTLVEALQADPPDVEGLGARFAAMQAAREVWYGRDGAGSEGSSGQVSAVDLGDILARPEFQWDEEARSHPIREWWERVQAWLWEQLFDLLPSGVIGVPGLNTALLIVGALVLAVILAFALRGVLGGVVAEAGIDDEAAGDDEALTAETALERAQEVARGGDYRSAVRYLYLSTLLQLEERSLLRYDRAATNREYLRRVADRPDIASVLRDVVEVFDATWYGFHALDAATYAEYEARVGELRRMR